MMIESFSIRRMLHLLAALTCVLGAGRAPGQTPQDPFPEPIPATDGVIRVGYTEFAALPDIAGVAPRMMLMLDEPGTRRLFVNDQRGPIYAVSYDGRSVALYVDASDPRWGVGVQSQGRERGIQSFAFHPQFAQAGAPGFGKFYTWTDVRDTIPPADFLPSGGGNTHDLVLHEWTAPTPGGATYDGGPPRELMRFQQPYANHNGGRIAFNPLARPGQPDLGLLYVGIGDGGSGGDPNNHAQNLASGFGKLFRIDPLGTNSRNGRYGIPASNPFAGDDDPNTLGEIFAYGLRNPQHVAWDARTGRMFLTDVGQGTIEELDTLSAGSNLGWNTWEGSFRFSGRAAVALESPRSDPKVSYPIAEYAQSDSLLQNQSASSGLMIYRGAAIPQLANLVVWADLPSGEIFHVSADRLPNGGQSAIRRVLLNDGGVAKTLLEIIREKRAAQGRNPANRVDLRFGFGPNDQLFLLNKADGVIRLVTR
jgi:hypothetical protein